MSLVGWQGGFPGARTPAAASQENEAAVYGSRGAKSTPRGCNCPSRQGDPGGPPSAPRIKRLSHAGERLTGDGPGRNRGSRVRRRQALAAAYLAGDGGG